MIQVPKHIYQGLEAVRLSGATNMLDVPKVIQYAERLGFPETAQWIREHRSQYVEGVFQGFEVIS